MSPHLKISAPTPQVQGNTSRTSFGAFRQNPVLFLVRWLYAHNPPISQSRPSADLNRRNDPKNSDLNSVVVVCVSDTHNTRLTVPPGDILLHAGDLTNRGTFEELQSQLDWLNTLPHAHKIVIGGNHDLLLDDSFVSSFPNRIYPQEGQKRKDLRWGGITYLQNSSTAVTVRGRSINVFGSPQTPDCGSWAFQYPPIRDVWRNTIPTDTHIILTHGPPKGHLDSDGKGCEWLNRELWRKKPTLVVFGHIHEARGKKTISWDYVQRIYDGVLVGDRGLFSVFCMAAVLAMKKIWLWRSRTPNVNTTTLINAAVVGGRGNVEQFSPQIVEI